MIVSASYKTDIPAFYGDWFLNRVRAGYCLMRNPYGGQIYQVSLTREDVDGFVFWTKNIGPFEAALQEVENRGFPFVIQYTINGYPRMLEFSVLDAHRAVGHMQSLAKRFGPRHLVWRYDPVVISSLTPFQFHIENFTRLARALEGSTDEVVISFSQIYKKTRRNMDWAASEFNFTWTDPTTDRKTELLCQLADIAWECGMQASICSQPDLIGGRAVAARCVDVGRLSDVAGESLVAKVKGNREGCECNASRDIGDYDTCPHGCVYCYAVRNRGVAQARFREHDPTGELLFGRLPPTVPPRRLPNAGQGRQLRLF